MSLEDANFRAKITRWWNPILKFVADKGRPTTELLVRYLDLIRQKIKTDRRWQIGTFVLGLLFLGLLVTQATRPSFQVIAFFENGWGGLFDDSFPSLQKNYRQINVISPFWYSIGPDGNIAIAREREEVINFARSKGIQIMPLFNNKKGNTDENGMFLADEVTRARAIDNIINIVNKFDYDGVNIDFELLKPDMRENLTRFVQDLSRKFPGRKILSMAVVPKIEIPFEIQGVYNYPELVKHVDYLVIMAYDRHYEGSPPGPVSPLPWVRSNVKFALDQGVPAQKLVLAAGNYGYDWPLANSSEAESETVPTKYALIRAQKNGVQPQWDETSQNAFYRYTKGNVNRVVWFQNSEMVRQRIKLAREFGLRGVALWRLGYEEPRVWEVVRAEVSR